jgi:hypothetical protein
MTWSDKINKLSNAGLMLFALIPFFFACNDPNSLGLELDNESAKSEVKVIEFNLPAKTIYIDSLRTEDLGSLIFGSYYNDTIFGDVKARAYVEYYAGSGVLPSSTDSLLNDTLVFESAFLYTKYRTLSVKDEFAAHEKFTIHLTKDTLFSSVRYLANMHTPFDASKSIASYSEVFEYRDDSISKIRLNDDFGRMLFAKLDSAGRSKNTAYKDSLTNRYSYYPALVLEPSLDYEHLLTLDLSSDTSGIYINMKSKTGTGKYLYRFTLGGDYYSEIIRDRSTGKHNDLIKDYDESSIASGNVHLNTIAGFHPKLDLSEYINFVKNTENIIINRAELAYSHASINPTQVPPVKRIRYYFPQSNGRINILSADGTYGRYYSLYSNTGYLSSSVTSPILTTLYNDTNQNFSSLVTFFCQDILNSHIADIDPVTESLVLWSPDATTVGQTAIPKSSIILKVYYTTLK